MVNLVDGPVTREELNEQVKHANEVYYAKNAEAAALWIEKTEAFEKRHGRPATTFRIGKIGRQVAVFVNREAN